MQLFVRTLSGRTAVVQASPEEPLAAATARVCLGAPAHLLRLASRGRELDAACSPRELQLEADATLHASLRLRGGAPTHVKLVTQRCAESAVTVRRRGARARSLRSLA